jgi:hypothetical protein
MYDENKINAWKNARNQLLSEEMRTVFSNEFVKILGI